MIHIRTAKPEDREPVWKIIEQVISSGDTYVFPPGSDKTELLDYWFGEDKHSYVALEGDKIVGTFIFKANQPGLGSHVANASYMTDPSASGKGIGTQMGEFSLVEAKRLGYKAMQFNIVVKSNERAVQLWKKLGFEVIGEIPEAFDHARLGLTNAYVMWKKL